MTIEEIARRSGVPERTVVAELTRICGKLIAQIMIESGISGETAATLILLLALDKARS